MLASLALAASFSLVASGALVVTSAGDGVDGDISSAAALARQPGGDGITLREALMSSVEQGGGVVIEFSSALAGATISIGQPLPVVSRSGVTLRGFALANGEPAITISGAQQTQFGGVLLIGAGDVVLSTLRIENVARGAAITLDASLDSTGALRDVMIEGIVFRHALEGAGPAILITTGSRPGSVIRQVTVARNRILQWDGAAIDVTASADGGRVEDVHVDGNEIDYEGPLQRGAGVLLGVGDRTVKSSVTRVAVTRNRFAGFDGE